MVVDRMPDDDVLVVDGAIRRGPLRQTIAAGMLVGTLFTLFVVPVFYLPFKVEESEKNSDVRTVGDSVV